MVAGIARDYPCSGNSTTGAGAKIPRTGDIRPGLGEWARPYLRRQLPRICRRSLKINLSSFRLTSLFHLAAQMLAQKLFHGPVKIEAVLFVMEAMAFVIFDQV